MTNSFGSEPERADLMAPAIIAITDRGAVVARRLGQALSGSVYLPERYMREDGACYFRQPLATLLVQAFGKHKGLVCVMAAGIVIRLLAPHLKGKQLDPAVVVVDEAGRYAISLLSGHLGGGNQLAREVAAILNGQAVITTATDVNNLPAWDDVARTTGMGIEPLANIKQFNRRLLTGEAVVLIDPQRMVSDRFAEIPSVVCVESILEADAVEPECNHRIIVTHELIPEETSKQLLLLRPKVLYLGIGCNRGTPRKEITEAVQTVLYHARLAISSVAALATIADKSSEGGLTDYAEGLKLRIEYFTAEALNQVAVPSPPSEYALRAVGASGVCEPAAVLAAHGGQLLVRKQKLGNVTVAVAVATAPCPTNLSHEA